MLQKLGLYLTQNRRNVIIISLICALLPFVGIPTSWINILIIGLITLRNGAKEGLWVILWTALPSLALFWLGQPSLFFGLIVLRGMMVWSFALILRSTASWSMVLQCAAIIGILGVAVFHLIMPDPTAWWAQQLTTYWDNVSAVSGVTSQSQQVHTVIHWVARMATGLLTASLLLTDLFLLCLARGWQAVTFNPKGLRKELLAIRMGYIPSGVFLLSALAAFFNWPFIVDVFPVIALPFILAGLSLIHAKLTNKKDLRLPILIILYILLVLFLQYAALLLAGLAVLDSWYNFRSLKIDMLA